MSNKYLDFINDNGGPVHNPNAIFLLAIEYEKINITESIKYYIMRSRLNEGSVHERYMAFLKLGRLCTNKEDKFKYLNEGINLLPKRLECYYEMITYYHNRQDYENALKWGIVAPEGRINGNELPTEFNIYKYLFDLDLSLVAYYGGKYQLANDINQRNMIRNKDSPKNMERLTSNQKFFDQKVNENGLIQLYPKK